MGKLDLLFNAGIKADNTYMYAVSVNYNALFKANCKTGECEYLGSFPEERNNATCLYFEGCMAGEKLFWSPQKGKHVGVYDIKSKKIQSLNLPRTDDKMMYCSDAVAYLNKAYMLSTNGLILYEIESTSLTIQAYKKQYEGEILCRRCCLMGNFLYAASVCGDELIEWNLDTKECIIRKIGKNFRGAYSLCVQEENIWMAPRFQGDPIVSWSRENSSFEFIENPYDSTENAINKKISENKTYLYCFYDGTFINMVSERFLPSIKINPISHEVLINREIKTDLSTEKMGVFIVTDSEVYLGRVLQEKSYYHGKIPMEKYDIGKGKITETINFYTNMTSDTFQKMSKNAGRGIFVESQGLDLKAFINLIG